MVSRLSQSNCLGGKAGAVHYCHPAMALSHAARQAELEAKAELLESNLIRILFGKLLAALRIDDSATRRPRVDVASNRRQQPFSLTCDGLAIRGQICFPTAHPSRLYPALILCHGIPGSGQPRPLDDPGYEALIEQFTSMGIAAVFFNFRGCGDSGGNFDMMGWARDLETVLDHVLNAPYIDPTRVIVLGFSGGGAAAVRVASETDKIFGLAIVGAPAHFRIFEDEPAEILRDFRERGIIRDRDFPKSVDRWMNGFEEIEPRRWCPHFKGKHLLVVHGDEDDLIPVEHAGELMELAPAGTAEMIIIEGGVHRLRLDPRCIDAVKQWVLKILGW